MALILLLGWHSPAQTVQIISSNSFAALQNAVVTGGIYQLTFNGTVAATSPLIVSNTTIFFTTGTNSVTVSGGNSSRIFQVLTNVSLTLSNLTLSGGNHIGTNGANGANGTTSNGRAARAARAARA